MRLLLAALLVLAILPAAAGAQSTTLTWGTFGHGTITTNGPGPEVCATAVDTPQDTRAACTAINANQEGNCPAPRPGNCGVTLTAAAPAGWRFIGWSGNRCNTVRPDPPSPAAVCGFPVAEVICGGPDNACDERALGPFEVVAHFKDERAPSLRPLGGPAENQVVVDDSRRQQFTFAVNEADEAERFRCRLDGGAFGACTSPRALAALADGVHDFCVQASDPSGNSSAIACRRWEQQTRPTAGIVTHPDAVTRAVAAGFSYASNKTERLTFECALDAGSFAACPATGVSLGGLGDGAHRFSVRSVFRGVLDGPAVRRLSEVASFSWTIDTTPPETSITAGPAEGSVISDVAPAFSFEAGEEGSSFACSVDGGAAVPCVSPFTAPVLASGEHTVTVTATDALGNVDPTPAVRRFSLAVFVPAPVDRDRDGYAVAQDCNDTDPAINPGAREVPGNRVDEDCDGAAAPFPRILALVTHSGNAYKTETRFSRMGFSEVPPGGKAELRCTARRKSACPFTRRAIKLVRGAGNGLTKAERRRGLAIGVGATLDARITAPQMVGRVRRFKIAKLDYPKGETLCLPPGITKPRRCPPT